MQARASNKKSKPQKKIGKPLLPWAVGSALLSTLLLTGMTTRLFLLMDYRSILLAELSVLEPLLAGSGAILVGCGLFAGWTILFYLQPDDSLASSRRAIFFQLLASAPWLLSLARTAGIDLLPVSIWEPVWSSCFFGLSTASLAQPETKRKTNVGAWSGFVVLASSLALAVWWYFQTVFYYDRYLLGFNDFGHFTQRIANTANGNGFLLETPVLPAFWDHFNPALVLLVPLWSVFESVHVVFVLQAVSLAASGWLAYRLALACELSQASSACVGMAFLLQPTLGQMNLAYTYGWHPVTFAIPILLIALIGLRKGQVALSGVAVLLAMTVEEGVFVVVGCFAASCAIQILILRYFGDQTQGDKAGEGKKISQESQNGGKSGQCYGLGLNVWLAIFIASAGGFVLVYKLSGLEDFQTGRFVALGNSLIEILCSPVMRPTAFWGAVFKMQNLAYVVLLAMPCFVPSLIKGWKVLLTLALPLSVLIIWDHLPATCLSFQYPSTLLPFLWLGAIEGIKRAKVPQQAAAGAFSTSLALSLFFSQLPYSPSSIQDVVGITYGTAGRLCRSPTNESGKWLNEKVNLIRGSGLPVLATGRIAAHLVGNEDVETVLQFDQRRKDLTELDDRKGDPLRHYSWVLLDRREAFQQSPELTVALESELRSAGFKLDSTYKRELNLYKRMDETR